MIITVHIPSSMRALTGGQARVSASGRTVAELIDNLDATHRGVRERLLDTNGVRRFVNLYIGEDDIRFLSGLQTELESGDALTILPTIAGG